MGIFRLFNDVCAIQRPERSGALDDRGQRKIVWKLVAGGVPCAHRRPSGMERFGVGPNVIVADYMVYLPPDATVDEEYRLFIDGLGARPLTVTRVTPVRGHHLEVEANQVR